MLSWISELALLLIQRLSLMTTRLHLFQLKRVSALSALSAHPQPLETVPSPLVCAAMTLRLLTSMIKGECDKNQMTAEELEKDVGRCGAAPPWLCSPRSSFSRDMCLFWVIFFFAQHNIPRAKHRQADSRPAVRGPMRTQPASKRSV